MNIECITFDLDDTLWPVLPVIQRAEARFYAWLREHQPQVCQHFTQEALIAHRMAYFRAIPEAERYDFTRLRRRWLRSIAALTGACPDTLSGPGFQVFWLARNEVEPDPEALGVLRSLRAHFKLGAVSNGNADVFRTPLGAYFDFSMPAAEAGAAKPDRKIFMAAAERAGVAPQAMLHIGDDALCDVVGARRAGLQAVWFNPKGLAWEHAPVQPDWSIRRLGQIPIQLGLVTPTELRR